jgi:hypothetical protein
MTSAIRIRVKVIFIFYNLIQVILYVQIFYDKFFYDGSFIICIRFLVLYVFSHPMFSHVQILSFYLYIR